MSYFLREVVNHEGQNQTKPCIGTSTKLSEDYAELLRTFHSVPSHSTCLKIPAVKEKNTHTNYSSKYPSVSMEINNALHVVGAPSSFATMAIAKCLLEKYGRILVENNTTESGPYLVPNVDKDSAKLEPLTNVGLSCVFDILLQLSKRDPELCVQALTSLHTLLQNVPVDGLRHESASSISTMMDVLKTLRQEGSTLVCSKASACMTALAVASGQPCHMMATVEALLTVQQKEPVGCDSYYDSIVMPDNLHKVALKIKQKVLSGGDGSAIWSARPLEDHRLMCFFDLPEQPFDSPADTPEEDMRLFGSTASDGKYLYVLNYLGLYKLGTGLLETLMGKLYCCNASIRASKNCMITFCNSSLYLRRGQSSCISVIDTDSLRDIGEVILPASVMQTSLFSDGFCFYSASVNQQSTFSLIPLNDSFVPSSDTKSRKKFRLTDVSYYTSGDTQPIPHELPLNLPITLHNQAVDLQMGREVAFIQSRSGKIFYAGSGSKYGLQETGTTWMELVLPEPVVQLAVGSDRVLLRSGSGHIWAAGGTEKARPGKLRKVVTAHKRKAVSIATSGACFAYVTENGRVYLGGRHTMRTHPESGLVLGLEGISIVTISLGKTHAVAVSRHGHLYTWGLNNLNQCGRVEASAKGSPALRSGVKKMSVVTCEPTEHLFVKDVPSICLQCGFCSARGSACMLGMTRGETCQCGPGESACLRCGICRACADQASSAKAGEPLTPSRTIFDPARLTIVKGAQDVKVAQVSCGNFHTVLLAADRRVFAFGSNCHGQLGCGDTKQRVEPVPVLLPTDMQIVQVACGSNHSVLRTTDGAVYTFGAHKHGQLHRPEVEDNAKWYCVPGRVEGFGPGQPSFASWVGAVGDTTLIHSHKALITNDDVIDAQIVATKNDIFIFPRTIGLDYLSIRRKQNTFSHYQLGPAGLYTSWCLEPRFDLLWSYNAAEMRIEARSAHVMNEKESCCEDALEDLSFMRCPEYAIPHDSGSNFSSIQLAISLMSSVFAATTIYKSDYWLDKPSTSLPSDSDLGSAEGYSVVSRFEGTGGGWGYSAHSVEAIQFMVNKDIKLLGIGLYGGRGEYIAKIKLLRLIGMEADEMYVEHLTESDETLFDSNPRETASLMLSQPALIKADQWHVISAKISGPSSDCGAAGRSTVECDDVTFSFRNSAISNNGTDVNVGQIPELYYQVDNQPSGGINAMDTQPTDDMTVSKLFTANSLESVTPSLFNSLLAILEWTLAKVFQSVVDEELRIFESERSASIAMMTLRMMGYYWTYVYSPSSQIDSTQEYATCLSDLHKALIKLFRTAHDIVIDETYYHRQVLSEVSRLFQHLSHAFLSSRSLIMSHLAAVMTPNAGVVYTASILGSLRMKDSLLDIILRQRLDEPFPRLADLLQKQFDSNVDVVNTLTSFPNILRFLYDRAFGSYTQGRFDVASMAQDILVKISEQLAIPNAHHSLGPTLQQSASRFRRKTSVATWDMSDKTADAIAVRVEGADLLIHGIGVYLPAEQDINKRTYNCEVYRQLNTTIEQWECVTSVVVELNTGPDTGIIRLEAPLQMTSGVTYGFKVFTSELGMRTFCGEGGVTSIRLESNIKLHFSSCSLSENGTTVQRGQLPFLLYSLKTNDSNENDVEREEVLKSYFLLLRLLSSSIGNCITTGTLSTCCRSLMSRMSGHVMVFMERHPEKSIEIMAILEQLLPMVSSINGVMKASTISESFDRDSEICETKATQVVVESPHPYKSNSVHSMVVGFDQSVDFMCVQFSSSCETSQVDDQLSLYLGINRECYVPIGRYFGSRDWPRSPLLLPGNSLWFVLETNSEVEGLTPEQMYGFHCTITGYPASSRDGGLRVEQELAWLSASACRILVQLPSDPSTVAHLAITEDDTRLLLEKHGNLLKRGLSLTHQPTLNELITKGLPQPAQTPDVVFLREFVAANPSTTPGLLSKWLPAGPIVDPSKCQLTIGQTEMIVGKKVSLRVTIKDQFDRPVICPNMDVEVHMTTGTRTSGSSSLAGGSQGLNQDAILKNPYQPLIVNRSKYMSICAMPVYADYCYEEIRLAMTKELIVKDCVKLRHRKNSTFLGDWMPIAAGVYRVECKVDGFDLSHTYTVHVAQREVSEQELKSRREQKTAQLSRAQVVVISPLSEFQGIRMRAAPSLVANTIGVIPRGGSISYIELIENEEGKWLRLTDETAILYGSGPCEQVWCMAYHNVLRRELIPTGSDPSKDRRLFHRLEEHPTPPTTSSQQSVIIDTTETYVIEAGESLPLYTRPSPDGLLEGEKIDGKREICSDGWVSNQYGVWIKMSGNQKYVLVENAVGRSSIHSQSFSTNGNDDEEISPPPRNPVGVNVLSAMRPLVADCSRAVFAAFLWHEHLVKDAMAAAAYLKFHVHLHNLWSSVDHVSTSTAPPALQPIVRLWKEVCHAVQTSVDQHLIMPPSSGKVVETPNRKRDNSAGSGCELCADTFKVPIAVHMRMAHPGCGMDSMGYGYNSKGRLTTGWSGNCGSGGRTGSAWYLMCTVCRSQYLRKTPAGHRQERTKRWREFRLSATAFESRPEVIIKQNALFLLDLNNSIDCDSKSSSTSSGWTVNLFPTQTPSPMNRSGVVRNRLDTSQLARSSFMAQSAMRNGHSSDPGPKVFPVLSPPTHQAPTSSLGQYPRKNSTVDHEQEVLQSPSAALRTLLSSSTPSTAAILKRPVMAFVVEHHNLKRMRDACEQAIRRAVSFSHAFQVWNWLLRLVSSETSVSDIIFQYLTAFSSYHRLTEDVSLSEQKVLPHPWRLCFLAGPLAVKVVNNLHAFLYTIAVILQSNGVDAKLRSLCFKAWTIQLTAHEQELLILTCNILATVGGVLSDGSTSDHWISDSVDRSRGVVKSDNVDVKEMRDLSSNVEIEASSRQAMVVCLTDGNSDTFWESGDEDKSRTRVLSIKCEGEHLSPVMATIFVDNVKDEGYRTEHVTYRVTLADGTRKEMLHRSVEANFSGWIGCCIAGAIQVQISLKGQNNSLRVRQLLVLGFSSKASSEAIRPSSSHQLFFSNTQLDAFALFQAISAQAFGTELSENQQGTLQERVVDLLCSRVQLQPLQNYVGTQVVNALEREVDLLCTQSKRNYSYACGLLDMLERICISRKGGELFAARNTILMATSQLIIFAPQVVQCQAIHVLEKLLFIFSPETVDVARFLRNILIVVAKVIVLQVRDKAAHSVTTAIMNDSLANPPQFWRCDKVITPEIGRLTTQLMNDLCTGIFSAEWAQCMRHELASALLNVVQLTSSVSSSASRDSINRESVNSFLGSKRFWLSIAALALIKDKSWLKSADKWNAMEAQKEEQPETLCENHDDGQTCAQVFCTVCETALCRECFTVMHLHKKNRHHRVQALSHSTRPADIDVHQGCARMRLQQLLVLFHGDTLNGLVEISSDLFPNHPDIEAQYRSTISLTSHHSCRFCGNSLDGHKQMYVGVCDHEDCVSLAPTACEQVLPCGHFCAGIKGESDCLPCLTCHADANQQDGDDVCVICFTDRLGAAPTVKLGCGHLFHFHCLRTILEKRWNGPRIHFRFINCPLCNQLISHVGLDYLMEPILQLREDVMYKAKMRLEYDGLLNCPAVTDEKNEYFNRPEEYAMERYMYVLCSKCNKAYFGGESRCQQALNSSQYNPDDLICGGCSDTTGTQVCGRHGVEFLEYKCRYCCSIAVYFCFGTTHFCAACHDDFQRLMCLPKMQLPRCPAGPRGMELEEGPCPLKIQHPPTGEEFAMGCGICRNINTF